MRLLFLTHRLPYAPNRGDRIRAFHMLDVLRREFDVTVVSLVHDDDEAGQVANLRNRGCEVHAARVPRLANGVRAALSLPSRQPLTLELLHSRRMKGILEQVVSTRRPDVVLAYCSSMARYALAPPLADIPFVLDMVDVDSEKWAALAQRGGALRYVYRRESRCLADFERIAIRAAATTLVVNEREERSVDALVAGANVLVVPNGIDVATFQPIAPPSADPIVVFCGVMNYAPNVEAAVRLGRGIWPRVLARRPDARLWLVGANPHAAVRKLADEVSVTVTGSVPDVRPYLWDSAVAAAPLITARGIQNKVLEALAAGLPCVISPAVATGLPATALAGCRTAQSDEQFAEELLALLDLRPEQRRHIAGEAALEELSWTRRLDHLPEAIRSARVSSTGRPVAASAARKAARA